MRMKYFYSYSFPGIRLVIEETGGMITAIAFGEADESPEREKRETPLIKSARKELSEYFAGERKSFGLPIAPSGTKFQKAVWGELLKIPYGETASYGEIACRIGKNKASRAVGSANHNNPISIVIPCHRVIGKNGSLTGYGGGLEIKKMLLEHERKFK